MDMPVSKGNGFLNVVGRISLDPFRGIGDRQSDTCRDFDHDHPFFNGSHRSSAIFHEKIFGIAHDIWIDVDHFIGFRIAENKVTFIHVTEFHFLENKGTISTFSILTCWKRTSDDLPVLILRMMT